MMRSNGDNRNSRAPTDIDRTVGDNLRRLRLGQGLTLARLSEMLGISHQQLQKYETGVNRMSAGMLSHVADALAIPIRELFRARPGKRKVDKAPGAGEVGALRRKCRVLVERVGSVGLLEEMALVLKALSK